LLVNRYGQLRRLDVRHASEGVEFIPSRWIETEPGSWLGPVALRGRPHAVSVSDSVRAWDITELDTAFEAAPSEATMCEQQSRCGIRALTATAGRVWAASDLSTLRSWDEVDGSECTGAREQPDSVVALAAAELDGRPLVLVGLETGLVRSLDAATGEP